jgi:hypothetical protein
MLVLGDVASEGAEKVFEVRELELEDLWKMPIFTILIQLFPNLRLKPQSLDAKPKMPDQQ